MGGLGGFQIQFPKNESMSKSSMLVSIFKCRLWMAWESRLWEDLIYFALPENSGKTVQGRRLILLPKQPQKMVFVQLLWSSHNICNNLQSSWVLNIKVEESTRSWLFFLPELSSFKIGRHVKAISSTVTLWSSCKHCVGGDFHTSTK